MPAICATRRASSAASGEQQLRDSARIPRRRRGAGASRRRSPRRRMSACLLCQQRGSHARIHAAAHGGHDPGHQTDATSAPWLHARRASARRTRPRRLDGQPHVVLGRCPAQRSAAASHAPARARCPSPAGRGSARPSRWCRRCRSRPRFPPGPARPPGRRPRRPSIRKLALFGSRSVGWPVRLHARQRGQAGDQLVAQRRQARILGHRGRPGSWASSSARANPTMPATFSVPARRCRSCEPPESCASSGVPCRTNSAPTPFGPFSLCADRLSRSACSAVDVQRQVGGGLHRVDMEEHAGAPGRWRRSPRCAARCPPRCWRTSR